MYKILIVEDDRGIAEAVKNKIESWDIAAACVEDFKNVLREFTTYEPHMVLMDISLPYYNGYHWCTEIRRLSKVPVIFLSSAADNMNIVMAMNMGGDDFIAKPFDAEVLMAKIMAMLRRAYDFTGQSAVLVYRDTFLDVGEGVLTYGKQRIALTKNEHRILQTLMEQKGRVVSREKLMEQLWETDSFIDDNTLTVNINRLRKKLEQAGLCDFITTKFGEGYLLESE